MIKIIEKIFYLYEALFHRSTGLVPQDFDERDYIYEEKKVSGAGKGVDLRDKLPMATNQNGYNSCVAHSTCRMLDYLMKYKKKVKGWEFNSSEAYQWYYNRLMEGNESKNSGSSLRNAFKVIQKYGFVPQDLWDYKDGIYVQPDERTRIYGYAMRNTYFKQLPPYYLIPSKSDSTISNIKNALDRGYLINFGMPTDFGYKQLKKTSYYESSITGRSGLHAQLVVGYQTVEDKEYFIISNSWSRVWGNNGYCFLEVNEFKRIAFDIWCLMEK